jgi:flagellar biosynthetic protein FlhB
MSDLDKSAEDRNLPASEKRLQDARADGQVPRSKELASFLILGSALFGLMSLGPMLFQDSMDLMSQGLRFDRAAVLTPASMGVRLMTFTGAALIAAIPVLALLLLAGIAAPLALGGWNFTLKPIMPDLGKLSPIAGLGRIFNKHGLIEMGKAALIASALTVVTLTMLMNNREAFAQLAATPLKMAMSNAGALLLTSMGGMVGILAISALIDVPAQLWRHHSTLKMTAEEVKRESRESDGDPQVKARIRSLQRDAARRRMMEAVPNADVIITNPTHFAVALAYDDSKMGAPRVVAKGADLVAARIRGIASEHGVPIMEQPALARALHKHAEIGEEVPVALYNAVAQILAYIYQLKHLSPGMTLHEPGIVDVPAGLDPQAPTS